jgi:DNA repair exonuclease SbcCD ATPase subunit
MDQDALLRKLAEAVDAWRLEAGEQTRRIQSGLAHVQEQLERVAEGLAVEDEREHRARALVAVDTASPGETIAQLRSLLAVSPAPGGPRLALLERCIARWSEETGASLREFATEVHAAAMQFERLESVLPPFEREASASLEGLRAQAAEQEALAREFRSTAEHAIEHADALELQVGELREALARERAESDTLRQQLDAAEARSDSMSPLPHPDVLERLENELDEERARNDRLELRISDADEARRNAEVNCEALRRELEAALERPASDTEATALGSLTVTDAEELRMDLETAQAFLDDANRSQQALEAECARLRAHEAQLLQELESLRATVPGAGL